MSIVCLNSKDQNPNEFFNQFPSGIVLPKNSEVCCFGWSANLKDISGISVTSENDTFFLTLTQEPNGQFLFPFIEFKITRGTYYSAANFVSQLNLDMKKRLRSLTKATIPLGVVASLNNGLISFDVTFLVSTGTKSYGNWTRWLGEGNGLIEIDGNNPQQAVRPGFNTLNFVDMKPLYPISNQTPTANVGAHWKLNLSAIPPPAPIGGLQPPLSLVRTMVTPTAGGGGSLVCPNPGDLGIFWTNSNGVNNYGIPLAANETNHWGGSNGTIGVNCKDIGNQNDLLAALQHTNAFPPGAFTNGSLPPVAPTEDVYITVRSNDPTREGLFVQGKITGIYSAFPSTATTAWDDPANTTLILNCVDISSNINEPLPNPNVPNSSPPRGRFYLTEDVVVTIETAADEPAEKLDVVGGILTTEQVSYFQDDISFKGNPTLDWSNLGSGNPNSRVGTNVLFGWRIDSNRNLISIKGNANDNVKEEALVVNIPTSSTTIEVMIEPVVANVNNVPTLELQLSYDIGASGTFTPATTLRPKSQNNFYASMPFHQAVAFGNQNCVPVIVSAIHQGDINDQVASVANPFKTNWAFSFNEKTRNNTNTDWKDTSRKANAKKLLGMFVDEAVGVAGAPVSGSYVVGNNYNDLPTNLLIQVPDLPITSYIGGASGMWGNVVRQASAVNIYNTQDDSGKIYEQFPTDCWLELKNQDEINLTQLSCRLTDNHNVLIDFLKPNTSVFLKFRRRGQNKLGGF